MEQSDLDLLQTVPPYHVQSVAKTRLGATFKGQSNETTLNAVSSATSFSLTEIAEALFDALSVGRALHHLSEIEQLILRELVSCGGRANSRDLALYFSRSASDLLAPLQKPDTAGGYGTMVETDATGNSASGLFLHYPAAHPHGVFEQAVRHLLVLGLVFWGKQTNFAGRDYSSGVHDGVLIVPQAIRNVVRQEWQGESTLMAESGSVDGEIGEQARTFQRTLYLYWSMVASMREGLSLVSNGLLARSSLRHVVEHLGSRLHAEQSRAESDTPLLVFVRLLLMKLGLLQERRGTIYALPAEEFFSLSPLERARRCYRLYVETAFWNELLYLPEVNVRPGPQPLDPAHEEIVRSRSIVIERVMREVPDAWHPFAALIARTKLYAPYLLFPRQYGSRAERYSSSSNPYGWDFRLRRGWLTHREGWHMVEGGFIRAVVMGPLHWLGLIDLDQEERPGAFRLAEAAPHLLSDEQIEESEIAWGRLIVQPNFELVALAPVSERLLVQLDRFADRVSLEHIAQYRVTKAGVTRAIQKGLRAEELQGVLEQAAGGEIPQNVRYSLVEWERQARRIEIWEGATLLEVDEEELLDELFANEETRALFGRRLGPRLVEVVPLHVEAVQRMLWQRNYLPALSDAPAQEVAENGRVATHEAQWRLHDDGLLQPLYAVLDLYLVAEVERFSQHDATTGWHCITPASLRKALESGMSLEHILRFLKVYSDGGIPGSLLIRLKLWGNGYDRQQVYVEVAPLLRLSAQVLQDLQSDREIQPLLGSEVEQQNCLVRVEANQLERILALLRARGFDVE
jgi:hypothetical protein